MAWYRARLVKTAGLSSVFQFDSRRHKRRYLRRLLVEPLENRCLPSTIIPTTFADGPLGSGSLRDAVLQFNADSGSDDDIIQLLAGSYTLTIKNPGGVHETAGLTGDLNLTQTSHRWIIQGAGPSTIIDASQLQDRVFQIVTPGTQVVFQDMVIQGGLAQDDGSDGAVAGTTDALGGGVLNNGGDVTFDHVVVQNNRAQGGDGGHNANGGGIYCTGGALTIAGATIANNQANGGRGDNGYHTSFGSHPGGDGGYVACAGLYASGALLDIGDCTIASNHATGGAGGDGTPYTYHVPGGNGGFAQGGGLYVNGSSLTLASSTLANNQAAGGARGYNGYNDGTGTGGGLANAGTLTVTGSTLSGNSADYGGGIYNYYNGTLTVSNSTLSGNTGGYGGGIYTHFGTLTVSNSTLSSNTAQVGGGIYTYYGTLTVSNSTLSSNTGGGIYKYLGTLTVSNSTLSGNTTSGPNGSGAGIYNWGTLTVSNTTLSGNTASGIYGGGGIFNVGVQTVTLTNVTLTNNRATGFYGGGLNVFSGTPVLHNTLIAGNFRGTGTTCDDVYGALNPSGDYNLIGDGTGMSGLTNGVNGNQVGSAAAPIDPLLGPLQDNGGPTFTHALLAGSPAIDAGNNAYATDWDQRGPGFPRIVNGVIDIGAFEVQGGGAAPPGRSLANRLVSAEIALGPKVPALIQTVFASEQQQPSPVPTRPLVEAPARWHDQADASLIPRIAQRATNTAFAAATFEAPWSELILRFF